MSTTLEELVISLQAENQDFIKGMMASSAATQKSMEAMSQAITSMATTGDKELSFFQQSMATMTGFLGGSVVTGAFNMVKDAASAMFQTFIVDGVAASSEAIDNMNQLNYALAQTGQYTEQSSDSLAAWAGELQKTTKYEDDAIIKSAAFIQTLGKLDEDGLKKATEGAMNLSAALGIDLDTATKMVGKAAAGEVAAFGKLGIKIEEGATKAETFSRTLKALADLGPAATKSAESYSGALARGAHAFGEIQEQTGGAITKNIAVIDTMNALSDVMFGTADAMDDNALSLRIMVAEGIVLAINTSTALIATLDALGRIGKSAFHVIESTALFMANSVVQALNMIGLTSDETANAMSELWKESAAKIATSFTEDTGLGMIGDKFAEIGLAAEGGLEKVRAGMVAIPEVTNQTNKATVELSESMKRMIEEGKNLAKSYSEAAVSGKAMADQQVADALLVRDTRLLALQEEQEARTFDLTTIEEKSAAELAIHQEFLTAKLAANEEAMMAEMEAVNAAREDDKISEESRQLALAGIKKKYSDLAKKEDQDMTKFKKTLQDQEVADRAKQIETLSGLQTSENAYAKTVGKAFSIANTIMKTQEGAQSAYSALAGIPFVGPALGAAAAAAVIADGATRISTIRGAANGISEVPGIGTRDTFGPVALAPGERVVPGQTNQDLKEFLAEARQGGGGGGMNIQVTVGFTDNAFEIIEMKQIERETLGLSARGA